MPSLVSLPSLPSVPSLPSLSSITGVDPSRPDALSKATKPGKPATQTNITMIIVILLLLLAIGLLVYVIVRGKGMAERSAKEQIEAKESFDAYVRDVAGGGAASELEKAASMHAAGKLTDDEYAALKARILS